MLISRLKAKQRKAPEKLSSALLRTMLYVNGYHIPKKLLKENVDKILDYFSSDPGFNLHLFDANYYQKTYCDIKGTPIQALRHFIVFGQYEGRNPCAMFNSSYYEQQIESSSLSEKVDFKEITPFLHYISIGWTKNLDPSAFFKTDWYIATNADVAKSSINPLFHFLKYGMEEGRQPHPNIDLDWFAKKYSRKNLPKAALLIDLVDNFHSKATSELDYQRRFAYQRKTTNNASASLSTTRFRIVDLEGLAEPSLDNFAASLPSLDRVKYLTVDIWDTILRRDCHPDEIKLQTSRNFLIRYKDIIHNHFHDVPALLRARFEAEREVATGNWEYRIEDVFARLAEITFKNGTSPETLKSAQKFLLKSELSAEIFSTRVDRSMIQHLSSYKRPIYFISDFYADSKFVYSILKHHKVDKLFIGGFCSCEILKNKREGEIYKYVKDQLEVKDFNLWTHIGDNVEADYKKAKSFNINAHLYSNATEVQRTNWYEKAYNAAINGDIQLHEDRIRYITEQQALSFEKNGKDLESAGARLAPIAVSFVLSVLEDAITKGVECIYFFTREGQFLKRIAEEIIAADIYCTSYPKCKLLEVSRRATFAPSLTGNLTDDLMRMWSQYSSQSPRSFASSLNLDFDTIKNICNRLNVNFDTEIDHPWNNNDFQALLSDEEFVKYFSYQVYTQKEMLKKYLSSNGFNESDRKPVICVDIGWRGTIQDNIDRIVSTPIRGHYLGLIKYLNAQSLKSTKFGWLYNENEDKVSSFITEVAPLEMIFNSEGGSVLSYEANSQLVCAQRLIFKGEEDVIKNFVCPLQEGMISVVEEVTRYIKLHGMVAADLRGLSQSLTVDLAQSPPACIADAFLALEHNETFGTGKFEIIDDGSVFKKIDNGIEGAELHHLISAAANRMRWSESLFYSTKMATWWDRSDALRKIAAPVALSRANLNRSTSSGRNRICVFSPSPIFGSGGGRTIFNTIKSIHKLGFEIHCFVDGAGDGLDLVEEWLGDTPAFLYSQWDDHVQCDYALATIATSARFVAELTMATKKGYLVQDFEAYFNPVSSSYIESENSYTYGLTHHTIGRWLGHVIPKVYGGIAISSGLGIDHSVYHPLGARERERAICFLYQPEKPRRLTEMSIKALSLIKKMDPGIKIYAYGSNTAINADIEIENLGLILDPEEINKLYCKCTVGLCVSLTNPSRIPFEMMAAGCIPVDLYRYNNLFDYDDGTAILAYQGIRSIAGAIVKILSMSADNLETRRKTSIDKMRHRTLLWESDVIANSIRIQLDGCAFSQGEILQTYTADPFIDNHDNRREVSAFCRHQRRQAETPAESR